MSNSMVSIIVPIYNTEKYLKRCLDSIVNQTYENYEVLLIDDGSTDKSAQICSQYTKKYNFVHYYFKKNGGLSDARNFGLEHASGNYIVFIDSDDYIDHLMVEKLYKAIRTEKADMSICGYYDCQKKKKIKHVYTGENVISSEKFFVSILHNTDLGSYAWNKMYLKNNFKNIRYPIGQKYEDINTTYKLVARCNRIAIINEPLYYYIRHADSITGTGNINNLEDQLHALIERNEYVIHTYPKLKNEAESQLVKFHIVVWNQLAKANNSSFSSYMNMIKAYILKNHSKLKRSEIKYRLMSIAIKHFSKIYVKVLA